MSCVGPDRLVGQLGMQRLDRRFRRTMLEILGIGSKETTAPFTVNWINFLIHENTISTIDKGTDNCGALKCSMELDAEGQESLLLNEYGKGMNFVVLVQVVWARFSYPRTKSSKFRLIVWPDVLTTLIPLIVLVLSKAAFTRVQLPTKGRFVCV